MSIETWIPEYYPRPAFECPESEALDDCERKWLGTRPEALRKHGLSLCCGGLKDKDGGTYEFTADNCALCQYYYRWDECAQCPLNRLHKGCCHGTPGDPWHTFGFSNDPEPMIALIQQAIANRTPSEDPEGEERLEAESQDA